MAQLQNTRHTRLWRLGIGFIHIKNVTKEILTRDFSFFKK